MWYTLSKKIGYINYYFINARNAQEVIKCLQSNKDDNTIQGLVGIRNDKDSHAVYLHWACTAPHNNIHEYGVQKYIGVGGHLFAIAADKSIEWGYEGAIHGFAANEDLLKHYMNVFHAEYLGMLHQYQFFIDEEQAKKLLEVYHYEWNEA